MLDTITRLAVEAGVLILALREKGISRRTKTDGSVVTDADQQAEDHILRGLAAFAPDIPVIAEERSAVAAGPAQAPARYFLIDPLDGTKEFVAGRSEFTVNVALIDQGLPIVGVVVAPDLALGYAAGDGQAQAFAVEGGRAAGLRRIAARKPPAALSAVVSRSHSSPEALAFLERFEIGERVEFGSSLKICRIAEGLADIYPRFGRTMEWDTAAADAVLRAAGGHLVTANAEPLRYGTRYDASDVTYANPFFVAVGDWSDAECAKLDFGPTG